MFSFGFLLIVFFHFLSLCGDNIVTENSSYLLGNVPGCCDIRTAKLYDYCDAKTITRLLIVNKEIRQEVNEHLFCKYALEKIDDNAYQLQNKVIMFYFFSSMYSLYGESLDWIEKPEKKELKPLENDENLYLSILAKKTELYGKFHNKFSYWLPKKNDIFDFFIKEKQIMKKNFNFVFGKNYYYSTKNKILYTRENSEQKLKEEKLFHYFCVYHATCNDVLKKETIKDIIYYYSWPANHWSFENHGACTFFPSMF